MDDATMVSKARMESPTPLAQISTPPPQKTPTFAYHICVYFELVFHPARAGSPT